MHNLDVVRANRHGRAIHPVRTSESPRVSVFSHHQNLVRDIIRPHGLQAKLTVSEPGDQYEQEADRVADAVMRMPEPQVQRQVDKGEEEEEASVQNIQAKTAPGRTSEAVADTAGRIGAMQGRGQPLPSSLKAIFEPRFGRSFSEVRVHTGDLAAQSARDLNALAFTAGHDVVFASGQYRPETKDGQRLLAHELVHVVQQANGYGQAGLAPECPAARAIMRQTSRGPADLWGKLPDPPPPYNPGLTAEEVQKFEQHCKEILEQLGLEKKTPGKDDTEKFKDAFKALLEPFFKTPAGKKILDAALSRKGLPLTLMVFTQALAGMIAAKTDIPSTPNIPLTGNLGLKFDFEGTFDKPKSVKVTLKYTWGGAEKKEVRPQLAEPPKIAPAVRTDLEKIDPDLLRKHTIERTFQDWELAGPDEEATRKRAYQDAKALPDARLVAEGIARQLLSGGSESILPPLILGNTTGWDVEDVDALRTRLEWLVNFVTARVQPAGNAQLVKFSLEGRPSIYVKIQPTAGAKP